MKPVSALPPGMSGRESRTARLPRFVRGVPVKRFVRCWPPSPIPIPPGGRHLFLSWRGAAGGRWSGGIDHRWANSGRAVPASGSGGWNPGYAGFDWVDAPDGKGKRRQQRPALPAEVMDHFLAWRDAMMNLVDVCRAAAPRLAAAVPDRFEETIVPQRRRVGVLGKRWVLEQQVQWGWLMAEWGLAGPPPGVRALRPMPVESSDRLFLVADGRIVLRRAGPDVQRPVRLVDDADFVQIVHREGLSEQLRRRLVAIFREAQLAAPFVPNRPSIDHADVWGKVAGPGEQGAPGAPGGAPIGRH